MKVRNAILAAANSIEHNPDLFKFHSAAKPDCNTPGCALGWIGAHLGIKEAWWETDEIYSALDIPGRKPGDYEFYKRMGRLKVGNWMHDHLECARALRLYADKYHPVEAEVEACEQFGG